MEKAGQAPQADEAEIRRAFGLLHGPSEVFEIRALGGNLRRTLSGYFDDHAKAASAALDCVRRGAEGVYLTLNPINPALLARSRNRLIEAQRNASTADKDVPRRRWLLIDLDPVRPSGVSSTDEEHRDALDKAREIGAWLQRCGFPNAILADSGNGAHLLYQVDLPVDDGGLVACLLATLDMVFSGGRVKVDRTTFNPARICKLYGTPSRKGDSSDDRPHRLAQLLDVPDGLERVARVQLEQITEFSAPSAGAPQAQANGRGFDARERLVRWGIDVLREESHGDGARLILRACPFGEHRKEGKAAVFINADSRLGFHCFSDDHATLGWKDLRAKFEPAHGVARTAAGTVGRVPAEEQPPPCSEPANGRRWPVLEDAAFHGIAGEFARMVEPCSEADPVAVLAQFLAAFGCVIGGAPHFEVEGAEQPARLNVVVVGETGRGRKRTAWNLVAKLLRELDPDFARSNVKSGLSSGEGLIWQVRDPIVARRRVEGEDGSAPRYAESETDSGIADKRLLVLEEEFAQALAATERPGNILSAVARGAWDRGDLSVLTKNSPARATGAHVAIVGHITPEELERRLSTTEAGNGFANRFLFVCARRSRILPRGGALDPQAFGTLAAKLRAMIEAARKIRRLDFDAEADGLWRRVYPALSEGRPGLLGAVTGRAEAYVLRLAVAFALLDASEIIRVPHLRAALALWQYAEDSARYLFGERLGDPDAELILEGLRNGPDGLTRTEIRDLFGRNRSGEQIDRALAVLTVRSLAVRAMKTTAGRSAEVWRLRLTTETTDTTKAMS
jgi:hypothetical protein